VLNSNNGIYPPTLVHNMPTEEKKVIQLKGEGNAEVAQKSFDADIDKCTEAILLDPQNPFHL